MKESPDELRRADILHGAPARQGRPDRRDYPNPAIDSRSVSVREGLRIQLASKGKDQRQVSK